MNFIFQNLSAPGPLDAPDNLTYSEKSTHARIYAY